jgi:hypothetical protein
VENACIYDEVTSATWFENAFNNSPASENGVLKTGCLFVALAVFSDGSPIDKQMKHSEHLPIFFDNVNLSLEGRKKMMDGNWYLFCQTLKSVIWRSQ